MSLFSFEKSKFLKLLGLFQFFLLFFYLVINIIKVGEAGSALALLICFFTISILQIGFQGIRQKLKIRLHFFVFLMFVFWVAFRLTLDFGDLYYLKQIIIATTGGIFLFFLMGTFVKSSLETISLTGENNSPQKFILVFSFFAFSVVYFIFSNKIEGSDIFLMENIAGGYQRAGNYLIIIFIVISYVYLSIVSKLNIGMFSFFFWFCIYGLNMTLMLVESQMMGSNAATANIFCIYLITIVISFLRFFKNLQKNFSINIYMFFALVKTSFFMIFMLAFLGVFLINLTDFDVNRTRIFGFGSGENTSVTSRFEIIFKNGMDQMGYSPVFGNSNVAYLTTGNAGATLHNFTPNIFAELGLVGLLLLNLLLLIVFVILIKNIKKLSIENSHQRFSEIILNFWLLIVLMFLFLFANAAVGKEWPVIWFYIGFSINILIFKNNSRKHSSSTELEYRKIFK
jgi:hypothetical protein